MRRVEVKDEVSCVTTATKPAALQPKSYEAEMVKMPDNTLINVREKATSTTKECAVFDRSIAKSVSEPASTARYPQ